MSPFVEALTEHFNTHRDTLVKKIKNRVGGEYNAEDVVQEAYTRALTYQNSYDASRPLEQWFNTILNNTTRDLKAEERRQGMNTEMTEEIEESLLDAHETGFTGFGLIGEMINKLSQPDRMICDLYFNKQYKPADIHKVVPNVNPTSIRQKIHLFKVAVKEELS
jgi:RNA polymerase sigma factor (sigma-70 family)